MSPFLVDEKKPIHLAHAIPDHHWVDSADGAAVRISMTVADGGNAAGVLEEVIEEVKTRVGGDRRNRKSPTANCEWKGSDIHAERTVSDRFVWSDRKTSPDAEAIAACFGRKSKKRTEEVGDILETLKSLKSLGKLE